MNRTIENLRRLLPAIWAITCFQGSAVAAELDWDTPPWIESVAIWNRTQTLVYYGDSTGQDTYAVDYNSDYGGAAYWLSRFIPVDDLECWYRWDYTWPAPYTPQTPGVCTYYDYTGFVGPDSPRQPLHVYGFDDVIDTWYFADYSDEWDSSC